MVLFIDEGQYPLSIHCLLMLVFYVLGFASSKGPWVVLLDIRLILSSDYRGKP